VKQNQDVGRFAHVYRLLSDYRYEDGSWGFRFAMECVADVAARTLTAETPSYATIMDLDRKVREFPIPEDASAVAASTGPLNNPHLSPSMAMMRCVLSHTREVSKYHCRRRFSSSHIDICDSLAIYSSEFLRPGYHRVPCQPTSKSLRGIILGCLSRICYNTKDNPGSLRHSACTMLSVLEYVDICILRCCECLSFRYRSY